MNDWLLIAVWAAAAIVSLVLLYRFVRATSRVGIKTLDQAGTILDSGGLDVLFQAGPSEVRTPSRLELVAEILDTGGLSLLAGPAPGAARRTISGSTRV